MQEIWIKVVAMLLQLHWNFFQIILSKLANEFQLVRNLYENFDFDLK